jgi:hypothetical protein
LNAVAQAADKTTSAGSEHVAITGSVTAAGQTVAMTGTGDFQASPKLGSLHLALTASGRHITMDEVLKGWTVFMKSPLFSTQLPSGKTWMSIDLQKAGNKLGLNTDEFTQQDPTDLLGALAKAGSLKKIGSEPIDGIDTTHYSVTIDLAKAPNGAQLEKLANLKSLPVDVWVDGNNQVRRLTERYTATSSGRSVTTSMQIDLSKYGEHVNVQVPSANDTVDMTSLGG